MEVRVRASTCKNCAEPAGFRYGSIHTKCECGNVHPQSYTDRGFHPAGESAPSEIRARPLPGEAKRYMSLFVLFRSAWRTASGSFPASWRTTTLLSLCTSKCSVGIHRDSTGLAQMFERGKGNSQAEHGRCQCSCCTCAAPEPLQEGFLLCKALQLPALHPRLFLTPQG